MAKKHTNDGFSFNPFLLGNSETVFKLLSARLFNLRFFLVFDS